MVVGQRLRRERCQGGKLGLYRPCQQLSFLLDGVRHRRRWHWWRRYIVRRGISLRLCRCFCIGRLCRCLRVGSSLVIAAAFPAC